MKNRAIFLFIVLSILNAKVTLSLCYVSRQNVRTKFDENWYRDILNLKKGQTTFYAGTAWAKPRAAASIIQSSIIIMCFFVNEIDNEQIKTRLKRWHLEHEIDGIISRALSITRVCVTQSWIHDYNLVN